MSQKIQMRRGLKANLPTLSSGELGFCTDTKELFIGTDTGNVLLMTGSGGTGVADTIPPVVTISPNGGTFKTSQTVTLSASETATIYYTLDNSIPTPSSIQYASSINLGSTTTVKYYAIDTAGNASTVQSATFTQDITAPNEISNLQKSNITATGVTLTWTASTSPDIASYDVYNGTTLLGNSTSTRYDISGLTGSTSYTFWVKAKDTVGNTSGGISIGVTTTASADVLPPNNVTGLTVTPSQTSVALAWVASTSTDTVGYDIYNGNIFITTVVSTSYTVTGLAMNANYTFWVKAKDNSGNVASGTSVSTKTLADVTPPTITASPVGGTYGATQTITLSTNETATIYYTVDGSTPTISSLQYTAPISVTSNTTLKYFGVDTSSNASTVQTQAYTIDTVTPIVTATPPAGSYNSTQSVVLSVNKQATIYYTTDSSTPTASSSVYSGPITVSTTDTIKYYAVDSLSNTSSVQSVTYTIDAIAPTVSSSVAGGTYGSAQTVSLTSSETATIYYTTDGSTPTASSTVYSTPVAINSTTTLKYFAIDTAGNASTIQTVSYIIDTIPPVVTASVLGGTYTSTQNVTLSANETATIYYTVDGSTPTTSSTVYSTSIVVSTSTTLKYFGRDTAGNASSIQTQIYTLGAATTGVSLNKTVSSVEEGLTIQLIATVTPSNAVNQAVSWSTSNAGIATVDSNGLVTGVVSGSVTITVTTQDGGFTATCALTVTQAIIGFDYNNLVAYPDSSTVSFDQIVTFTVGTDTGAGDWVHPSVLYFANGWNGHKYWGGFSPYPNTQGSKENTYFFYSDDGDNWVTPAGVTGTIFPLQTGFGNNSDPNTFMDYDGVTMHILNRAVYTTTPAGMTTSTGSIIEIISTTDGSTFTQRQTIIDTATLGYDLVAPSVAKADSKYYLFAQRTDNLNVVVVFSADTPTGTWTKINEIGTGTLGQLWHCEVRYLNKEFIIIGSSGGQQGGNLMLGKFSSPMDTTLTGRNNFFIVAPNLSGSPWTSGVYKCSLVVKSDTVDNVDIEIFVGFKGGRLDSTTDWRVSRCKVNRLPQTLDLSGYTQVGSTIADNSGFFAITGGVGTRVDYFKYAIDFTITNLNSKMVINADNTNQWCGFYLTSSILRFSMWAANLAKGTSAGETIKSLSYGISVNDRITLIQDDSYLSMYINGRLVGQYDNTNLPMDKLATIYGDLNTPLGSVTMTNIKVYKLPKYFFSPTGADSYKAQSVTDYTANPTNYWWYDEFNRANSTAVGVSDNGLPYTLVGIPKVSNNTLLTTSNTIALAGIPGSGNMQILAKVAGAINTGFSIAFKYTDISNNMRIELRDNSLFLKYKTAGSETSVGFNLLGDVVAGGNQVDYFNWRFDIVDGRIDAYADTLWVGWVNIPAQVYNTQLGLVGIYATTAVDYIVVKKLSTSDQTPPTIVASPVGGSYTGTQSVTLTASPVETVAIYYTTDGSTPVPGNGITTRYSSAVSLQYTTTLKYFAIDASGNASAVQSQVYTIADTTPPVITISPLTGTYNASRDVTLRSNEPNTTIYYTIDGTTPTTSSTVYTSRFTVSSTTTISYFGVDGAGNASAVQSATLTIDYTAATTVLTLNGTTSDTLKTPSVTFDSFSIEYSPDVSPGANNLFQASSTTFLTSNGSGGNIKKIYIDDVPSPDPASPYSIPGLVNSKSTVRADLQSPVTGSAYFLSNTSGTGNIGGKIYRLSLYLGNTIVLRYDTSTGNINDLSGNGHAGILTGGTWGTEGLTIKATPLQSTFGGIYSNRSFTLTPSRPSTIYYTSDSTTPTTSSSVYSGPITIPTLTTYKWFGVDTTTSTNSVVATKTYSVDLTAPSNATGLSAINLTRTTATLTWSEVGSADLLSYNVYQNGTLIANVLKGVGCALYVTGLTPNTSYTFKVTSLDFVQNESTGSTVTGVTLA